jgi:transcriptional regulator with XRE-family HTH domain
MQALFLAMSYAVPMTAKNGQLRALREKAGLTLRELARQVGEHPSNVSYWERTGHPPRSAVLVRMAQVLGVTVEDVLGMPTARRMTTPGGKTRQVFEAVSRLPRRQQQKIVEVVQALVAQHTANA